MREVFPVRVQTDFFGKARDALPKKPIPAERVQIFFRM